jgi:hypothetical protein
MGAYPYGPPKPKAPSGPNPGIGAIKIAAGAILGLFLLIAYLQQAHAGYLIALVLGVFLGAAARGVAVGIANVMRKQIPLLPSLGILGGVAVLCATLGPTLSTAFCESDEASKWDEITRLESGTSFDPSTWKTKYEALVNAKFQRPEWKGRWMLARVKEAVRNKRPADLRAIMKEIDQEPASAALMAPAREAATKAFRDYYDQAKAKLYAAPSSGAVGKREFEVDADLRRTFGTILDDLAQSPDANVYVAFTNAVKLDPPKGADLELALMRRTPDAIAKHPKGDAPVIQPVSAFSPEFDSRRRQTFMTAMSESFGKVFDSDLLTLVPLEAGGDRKGKIVFEVSSNIVRSIEYYTYTRTDLDTGRREFVGFLFGILVDWGFKVWDRQGKSLYDPRPTRSLPADKLRVERGENDPEWAMYSVMMDSAYYNYCREITGKFGLAPPPVRESFAYQGR